MAWEWSHTAEAQEMALQNLGRKSIKFLSECYAEWKCEEIMDASKSFQDELFMFADDDSPVPELPNVLKTDPMRDGRYEGFVKEAKEMDKDELVGWVWEKSSEQRTCENGGYDPWMCPHGCHKVKW